MNPFMSREPFLKPMAWQDYEDEIYLPMVENDLRLRPGITWDQEKYYRWQKTIVMNAKSKPASGRVQGARNTYEEINDLLFRQGYDTFEKGKGKRVIIVNSKTGHEIEYIDQFACNYIRLLFNYELEKFKALKLYAQDWVNENAPELFNSNGKVHIIGKTIPSLDDVIPSGMVTPFKNVVFVNCTFMESQEADFSYASFYNCTFNMCGFEKIMDDSVFKKCRISRCSINGRNCDFYDCDITNCILGMTHVTVQNGTVQNGEFSFYGVGLLENVTFNGANMMGDYTECDTNKCSFVGCDMQNAIGLNEKPDR